MNEMAAVMAGASGLYLAAQVGRLSYYEGLRSKVVILGFLGSLVAIGFAFWNAYLAWG